MKLINYLGLLALVRSDQVVSDAMGALYDVASVGSVAEGDAVSCTSKDSATASAQQHLLGDLQLLTEKLMLAEGAIQEWGSSSDLSSSLFDDEYFDDSMGQLVELFEALVQQSAFIDSSIQYILPSVADGAVGVVSEISPRYSCDQLEDWESLNDMMAQLFSINNIYTLDMYLPTTLPGSCADYNWSGMESQPTSRQAQYTPKSGISNSTSANTIFKAPNEAQKGDWRLGSMLLMLL